MYVVALLPRIVSSKVFWDPYVFSSGGAMSVPPPVVQGPESDDAVKTLFGLGRHPVLLETIR